MILLESIMKIENKDTRKLVFLGFNLLGILPPYGKKRKVYTDTEEQIGLDSLPKFIQSIKNSTGKDIEKEIRDTYTPDLDFEDLESLLDIDIKKRSYKNGKVIVHFSFCLQNYVYSNKRVYNNDSKEGDKVLHFISHVNNESITDVLYRYYLTKKSLPDEDIQDTLKKVLRNSLEIPILKKNQSSQHAGSEIESIPPQSAPKSINHSSSDSSGYDSSQIYDVIKSVTAGRSRFPRRSFNMIISFDKNEDGSYRDTAQELKRKTKNGEGNGFSTRHLYSDEVEILHASKMFIESRLLNKAINKPKYFHIDFSKNALVYISVFTLSGVGKGGAKLPNGTPSPSPFHAAISYRSLRFSLKFNEIHSLPIPSLLENLHLSDKELFVCEGFTDACFIKNAISINNWTPSNLSCNIIGYFEHVKKMSVTYITDNFRVGDKGGLKALINHALKDNYIFDWDIDCKGAKDIAELAKRRFCTPNNDGKIEIPRKFLNAHRRLAREVVLDFFNEYNMEEFPEADNVREVFRECKENANCLPMMKLLGISENMFIPNSINA